MLGVTIRLASEAVKYWDSNDEPAVVLRGGENLRADVSSRDRFGLAGRLAHSLDVQVVIVADGVHSPARWLLTPHARKAAEKIPSGYSVHRSAISAEKLKADSRCSRRFRRLFPAENSCTRN